MSTIKVTTIQNLSGVEAFTARAWVSFNGTGTVAIRSQGNVASITDNGTGDYTVNFTAALTAALPDANYATVITSGMTNSATCPIIGTGSAVAATTSLRRFSINNGASGGFVDMAEINFAIFR